MDPGAGHEAVEHTGGSRVVVSGPRCESRRPGTPRSRPTRSCSPARRPPPPGRRRRWRSGSRAPPGRSAVIGNVGAGDRVSPVGRPRRVPRPERVPRRRRRPSVPRPVRRHRGGRRRGSRSRRTGPRRRRAGGPVPGGPSRRAHGGSLRLHPWSAARDRCPPQRVRSSTAASSAAVVTQKPQVGLQWTRRTRRPLPASRPAGVPSRSVKDRVSTTSPTAIGSGGDQSISMSGVGVDGRATPSSRPARPSARAKSTRSASNRFGVDLEDLGRSRRRGPPRQSGRRGTARPARPCR